jgi:hypothetical protein
VKNIFPAFRKLMVISVLMAIVIAGLGAFATPNSADAAGPYDNPAWGSTTRCAPDFSLGFTCYRPVSLPFSFPISDGLYSTSSVVTYPNYSGVTSNVDNELWRLTLINMGLASQ